MKILNSLFLVFCSVVCLAQNYPPPEFEKALHEGAETKITIQVMDVFDNPVSNASVKAIFNMGSLYGETIHGKTSCDG